MIHSHYLSFLSSLSPDSSPLYFPLSHSPTLPLSPLTKRDCFQMWSPKPSVFSLLVSRLTSLSPIIATEYPAVHFALLYALFQDCRR